MGSVDGTPTHYTHLCSTVCSQARNAHHALGSSLHGLQCHLCAPEKSSVIWCCTCLILVGCLTCLSPRALHLPHSLFLLPRHKNTQHSRHKMINCANTQYIMHISNLPQWTSCAIKNHSGVKTCRVAKTRARQLPHPSSNPRTFRKYNQSCIARQCTVTRRFHRVYLSRKRKRIEVKSKSWFDSRRSQSQNRQTSCVLHCCESDG